MSLVLEKLHIKVEILLLLDSGSQAQKWFAYRFIVPRVIMGELRLLLKKISEGFKIQMRSRDRTTNVSRDISKFILK